MAENPGRGYPLRRRVAREPDPGSRRVVCPQRADRRIPVSDDRFAEEIAVERLVEARGVGLAREGDELVGLCVLCEAGEGLRIHRKANRWSCRSCGEGGGPVEWVMASRGVSRRHAVELLREGVTDGEASGRPPKRATATQLEPLDETLSDDELLSVIVAFYHRTLLESAEPSAFLSSRALANREAIAHFRLGYSNRTLGLRVPAAKPRPVGDCVVSCSAWGCGPTRAMKPSPVRWWSRWSTPPARSSSCMGGSSATICARAPATTRGWPTMLGRCSTRRHC